MSLPNREWHIIFSHNLHYPLECSSFSFLKKPGNILKITHETKCYKISKKLISYERQKHLITKNIWVNLSSFVKQSMTDPYICILDIQKSYIFIYLHIFRSIFIFFLAHTHIFLFVIFICNYFMYIYHVFTEWF